MVMAHMARRLQMGTPQTGGTVDTTLRDKMQRKMEVGAEIHAITSQFMVMLEGMERVDQYLPALARLLEQRKASPEVVRGVAAECKKQLERFYRNHAGSKAVLAKSYERGPRVQGDDSPTPLVPEVFATRGQLDSVGGVAQDMDAWVHRFIHPETADMPATGK
jgi:hypothetical protein